MSFKEKDFQSLFTSWIKNEIKNNRHNVSAAYELKLKKKGKKINFKSDFQPHQIPALEKVVNQCLFHKISDQSLGFKPFDCFVSCNNAYVCLMWYEPRKPKQFYMITIQFLMEFIKKGKKSLTEDDALSLGKIYQL